MLKSAWLDDDPRRRFPKLDQNLTADVVVVGGGITGATAAYLIKQTGMTVALVERDCCGDGDTAHTTAHLTCVTDSRLSTLVHNFGRDHAQAAWDAGLAAMHQIRQIIDRERIECDWKWVPGYLHAPWDSTDSPDTDELRDEAQLAAELGFAATHLDRVPLADRPGIHFSDQAEFHPLKYLDGALRSIPGQGSHVFEQSEVESIESDPLQVVVGPHRIQCGYVVVATHVPLMGKTSFINATLLQTKLASYSSYAVAALAPKDSAAAALYWDTADPYHYLRIEELPDRVAIMLGGEDHKTGQADDADERLKRLQKLLKSIFPKARLTQRWSGQVVESSDGLPFIGETADRQFVATGFGGNGMTFGVLAGMMARDAALGEANPWRELFNVGRTRVRGGAWNYLKENMSYPYYMLKDRLARPEADALSDVSRCEGKVLHLDGERVAVYRDQHGAIHSHSAVCPHMGCLVHWNGAERSWDCPCHGSRFKPTGEVIAGPAETPLPPRQSVVHA